MTERETTSAEDGGSAPPRLGPLVWIAIFAVGSLLAFVFVGHVLFQSKKAISPAGRDYFKRLSIEKPGKLIRAPGFTLEDLSGRRLSLKDLKGRVVFLNFWATWCVPCRQEMPLMEKLHRDFKPEGLEMVAVNFREDKQTVRKFSAELGLSFPVLVDYDGKVGDEYGAWSLPLTYIINRDGEFIGKTIGDRRWDSDDAKAFFRELVQAAN
jgi:thiol-disulfide isomerase/thioredoxin